MKVLVDLNVVLDVVQDRQPHTAASAAVLDAVERGDVDGVLPSHSLPTLWYLIDRYADRARADQVIEWLLAHFEVVPAARSLLQDALALGWTDYEDAVVARSAVQAQCDYLVTRNERDFGASVVPVVHPLALLARLP